MQYSNLLKCIEIVVPLSIVLLVQNTGGRSLTVSLVYCHFYSECACHSQKFFISFLPNGVIIYFKILICRLAQLPSDCKPSKICRQLYISPEPLADIQGFTIFIFLNLLRNASFIQRTFLFNQRFCSRQLRLKMYFCNKSSNCRNV